MLPAEGLHHQRDTCQVRKWKTAAYSICMHCLETVPNPSVHLVSWVLRAMLKLPGQELVKCFDYQYGRFVCLFTCIFVFLFFVFVFLFYVFV